MNTERLQEILGRIEELADFEIENFPDNYLSSFKEMSELAGEGRRMVRDFNSMIL